MNHLHSRHKGVSQASEAGFTLIELLISITLGLLVVAAASQLFVGGIVGFRLQQGAADTQDSGLFGLGYIAKDIQLANYGNPQYLVLGDTTKDGGVVLTADTTTGASTSNLTDVRTSNSSTAYVPAALISRSQGDTVGTAPAWAGLTKAVSGATQSDQLTIQFIAPAAMSDCEGNNVVAGARVVERFFLRADTTDTTALVLACDAGSITAKVDAIAADAANGVAAVAAQPPILNNLGGAGQVIMSRVEHLRFLLGTQTAANVWRYYSIRDYMALTTVPKPQVKSIQIAVLVRSLDNTRDATVNSAQTFNMLDQSVRVATADTSANRYVRRVYTTTVALRNGLGSPS